MVRFSAMLVVLGVLLLAMLEPATCGSAWTEDGEAVPMTDDAFADSLDGGPDAPDAPDTPNTKATANTQGGAVNAAGPDYRKILTDLYTAHNPAKLGDIDSIMEKYKGKYKRLVTSIQNKYGAAAKNDAVASSVKALQDEIATLDAQKKAAAAEEDYAKAGELKARIIKLRALAESYAKRKEREAKAAEEAAEAATEEDEDDLEVKTAEKDYRKIITKLYKKHNPYKLASIESIMKKYEGRYSVLIAQLEKKYKAPPPLPPPPPPEEKKKEERTNAMREKEEEVATGDKKRGLQYSLGHNYLNRFNDLLKKGETKKAQATLRRAHKYLARLWKNPGNGPKPPMMVELGKLYGVASRRRNMYVAASNAYSYIVKQYLKQIRYPSTSTCADPKALDYNKALTEKGEKGDGKTCVLPNTLRYYASILLSLERQLPGATDPENNRFGRAERTFEMIKKAVPSIGWTSSFQIPVNYVAGLEPALPIWVRSSRPGGAWGEKFEPSVPRAMIERGFPILEVLEENAEGIIEDLKAILKNSPKQFKADPGTDEHQLVDLGTGEWTQVQLIPPGMALRDLQPDKKGCKLAPNTCRIFRDHFKRLTADIGKRDGFRVPGSVTIAQLTPGTHLISHTGPHNNRLTIHLPLIAPDGPKMRVVDRNVTWARGKALMFDDSFEHEVWHEGDEPRFILHMNIWHPRHAVTAETQEMRNEL